MPPIKSVWVVLGLVGLGIPCLGTDSFGQGAVAFTPTIGSAPSGQTMTVTPAISADRRYVRLSVNPFFNAVNGFSSFTTPLGAVSGSGSGGGGLGGGGLGAALGAAGGLRGVGLGGGGVEANGGNFNAGMNGIIGPADIETAVNFGQMGPMGSAGAMAAGSLRYDGVFGSGFYASDGFAWTGWNEAGVVSAVARPSALSSPRMPSPGRATVATAKTSTSPRHTARKSLGRRQKSRPAPARKVKVTDDEEPVVKPKKAS